VTLGITCIFVVCISHCDSEESPLDGILGNILIFASRGASFSLNSSSFSLVSTPGP